MYPDDGNDSVTLLRNADMAMYRAKEVGRNTLQFYRPEMTINITEKLQLEMELRNAIKQNELYMAYQPQIDLESGKVVGLEALIRWQHPTLGLIPPVRFIPVAEESGLILEVGEWVLREVCMQGRIWKAKGLELVPIAVNVSGVQFKRGQIVERIKTILQETKFDPALLEIEITESVLMGLGEASMVIMNDLKALGVRLSLDDFGTGYSSLSRLKTFPLDMLKVDQSFVRDIHTDANDAAIVRAVLSMSHEMQIQVIAEGVETAEQLDFLKGLNCEKYQGYLFSRPVKADEIEQYLKPAVSRS